ncbi:MAG: hypothetical protein UW80_C0042G0002 [Microgenomates group bacterium GW2011_GWC1_44_9]|nr:MAG: hypothetical protein UW80_C0042G0002 [Microgenomates group bacterium GW2011_GWC1_44_9]
MCKWLAVIGISLVLILFIYPSAFIYPKDTLPDNNDTRLIAYIIGQAQKNILQGQSLHYGTFFAPDKNTLTYSDLFLTSAIITLPARLFTDHPIIIFNLALVTHFLLTIIASYLLFGYLLKDHWVTTLAVILFNFSGYHLHYLPHLQMFSLWPLLLSIYFFIRFQNENRIVFLNLYFLTVTAQIAESIFPVYLIFFASISLVIARFGTLNQSNPEKPGSPRHIFLAMTKYSLPFLPVWIFLLFPYFQLHLSLPEASRPIRDAAHFSLGLDEVFTKYHSWTTILLFLVSYLSSHGWSQNHYPILKRLRKAKKHGLRLLSEFFAARQDGFAAGQRAIRFSKRIRMNSDHLAWKIIFFFSLIMSLGPVLKIFGQNFRIFGFPIPLPYALFYYLFPGFTGFRTPSRFIVLTLLAAVIIIGFYLKPLFEKLKLKTKFIFILLLLSLLLLEADLPLKGYPVNINTHPVYEQVKALPPEAVILELPIKLWNMPDHEIESIRSLYSLTHHHRRLGGFSGFATKTWIDLVEKINTHGLNPENIEKLKSFGVTHAVSPCAPAPTFFSKL